MSNERVSLFDIGAEIARCFDDSSIPRGEEPRIVILMGGIASGKTTIRKERYSTGYVVVDAADIFLSLSRGGVYPFPEAFVQPMELIGDAVARRAVSERRHIVMESTGMEFEPTQALIETMTAIGYRVSVQAVVCDIEEAWRRNTSRGNDDISCYYAEPFHRRWLLEAAKAALERLNERA